MMPAEWKPLKRQKLEDDVIKTLKDTLDKMSAILAIAVEAKMPEVLSLWADHHTTKLNQIAGIALATLSEMPDQAYHFSNGTKCRILTTQEKNAKLKESNKAATKKRASATAATKKTTAKKGRHD